MVILSTNELIEIKFMATYVSYSPSTLIEKAMFNFDVGGLLINFKYSGTIRVSVSDSFSYYDWYYGLVNNLDWTIAPLSAEFNWIASDLSNIEGILGTLSNFANLSFSSVTDWDTYGANPYDVGLAGVSDINIAFSYNRPQLLGISGIYDDSIFGYTGARGDIFININGSAYTDGLNFADFTKSKQVLMHELCHSLGLSHPFHNESITSDYSALVNVGFQNLGFAINSGADLNKEYFSIMSYDDESNISYINAYTPMILDVIALQGAYGEGNGTHGSGNDFIQAGTIGYRTYFDKGGTDTIDASLYSLGCYLNMGTSINGAAHQVGILTNNSDAVNLFSGSSPQSLRWFYGEYENAIGSSSSDLIVGNSLSNIISLGSGNDAVSGLGGNDVIDCGAGTDTCRYLFSRSNYNISYASGYFTVSALTGDEGTDTVAGVEIFSFYDQDMLASAFEDSSPPSILISSTKTSLKSGETATISFTLSESSSDFTREDITVSGGTLGAISGSGTSYSATFTPSSGSTANGVVSVASATFNDVSGNDNTASNALSMTLDTLAPTISINSTKSSLKSGETATISFTLSESSSDFTREDITVSGGTLGALSGSGTSYSATFTPTAGSTTNGAVSVASGRFIDAAGNDNVDGSDANNNVIMTVNTIPSNASPTGLVSIKGAATQNQKLTASNTLKDSDGLGTIAYQWKADGSAISGATSSTFTLTQSQVGKAITVVASYTDRAGNAESVASSATASVSNVNDKPTGAVTISGTASQGQVLTASNTLADLDGLGTVSYAWYASKTLLGTGSTYTLTQSDVGKAITVTARYTDLQGTVEPKTSSATAKVANVNDAPTVANIIPTQTVVEGAPFSFSIPTNTFTDLDKDKLTYSATFNGSAMTSSTWGQLSSGKFTSKQVPYTAADIADNTIVLTASDGKGGSVSTSFTLRVTNTANINGTSKADTINAGAGADTINGLAGNDIISGGVGNDIIDGGVGNDSLTGGDGIDYFRFTTATKSNIDTITDFVHGTDKIQLDDAIFTRFATSVQSANLVSGPIALDSDDYLLYTAGKLYYDADGSGTGKAVQIALLGSAPTLTYDDFAIV